MGDGRRTCYEGVQEIMGGGGGGGGGGGRRR